MACSLPCPPDSSAWPGFVLWLLFPYNKLRRGSTTTQRELAPVLTGLEVPREFRLNPSILIPVVFLLGLLPGIVMFQQHAAPTVLHFGSTVLNLSTPLIAIILGVIPGFTLIWFNRDKSPNAVLPKILFHKGSYAFLIAKGLTDGVWWFYLFYLPQFLNRNYGVDTKGAYKFVLAVYVISSVGSIFGGTLSAGA